MENKKIWFANIEIQLHKRGKTWHDPQLIKEVVCSGEDKDIKKDGLVKRRLLLRINGSNKKAAHKYDLDRIRITKIERIRELGRGYMADTVKAPGGGHFHVEPPPAI